jgi:hypothetical protein
MRFRPKFDPTLFLTQSAGRQGADDVGRRLVRLLRPPGVVTQQHRGIMPAPFGDHVHGYARIQQRRLMTSSQIV